METQSEQLTGSLASEVVTTLLDLARIAQLTDFASSDSARRIAHLLLERLLALCAAQRGALFLSTQDKHTSRMLASHDLSEEEARAALELFPSEGEMIATAPNWLMSRLPLGASSVQQQGAFDTKFTTQSARPLQVVLLLCPCAMETAGDRPVFAQGPRVLPFIADAVGALIMHTLLAERIAELEQAAKKAALWETNLLTAELLATVSHELRSPLASIKGYTATLLRQERRISREERREFLLAIQEGSIQLEFIVDRLLEISQLEAGNITIEHSLVDIARLVREAMAVAEQRAAAQVPGQFTFHLRLKEASGMPTSQGPMILADSRRLRAVLDHLLENAMKYSPTGGAIDVVVHPIEPGEVSAATRELALVSSGQGRQREDSPLQWVAQASRTMLEICVYDHGLGIPDEHIECIFDRFHRVDTSLTREVSGLGLGLTICRRIVELHGGVIWAASCPGGGSAFHVWLPLDGEETSIAPTS